MAKYVVRDDGSPCTEEELKELVERDRPTLLARLAQVNSASTRTQIRHEFILSDEHKVTVLGEINGAYIRNVLRFEACPSSVEDALRLFGAHISARRYTGVKDDSGPTFLTLSAREQWTFDAKIWTESLESPAELDVEEIGSKAIVRMPTGHTVELTNEFDCWRIERIR